MTAGLAKYFLYNLFFVFREISIPRLSNPCYFPALSIFMFLNGIILSYIL